MPHLVRLKQAADLHSNRVSQWLVLGALEQPDWRARQAALADAYRRKRDTFAQSLDEHLADCASWERPPGGLFFWLKLKRPVDTRRLLETALSRGVAFMPGEPFYATARPPTGTLRLAFSHASETAADQGLRILAELVRESQG